MQLPGESERSEVEGDLGSYVKGLIVKRYGNVAKFCDDEGFHRSFVYGFMGGKTGKPRYSTLEKFYLYNKLIL